MQPAQQGEHRLSVINVGRNMAAVGSRLHLRTLRTRTIRRRPNAYEYLSFATYGYRLRIAEGTAACAVRVVLRTAVPVGLLEARS